MGEPFAVKDCTLISIAMGYLALIFVTLHESVEQIKL